MDTIDELTREYQRWLHNEGLPQVSAEELLRTDLTYSQHVWISIFIERWEFAQEVREPVLQRSAGGISEAARQGAGRRQWVH